MVKREIAGVARLKYSGSEEDWRPTVKFITDWHKVVEQVFLESKKIKPQLFFRLGDVAYATDEKLDGQWCSHFEVSGYLGLLRHRNLGGGVSFTEECPNPWTDGQCLALAIVRPYLWFNPETKEYESGHLYLDVAVPLGRLSMEDTQSALGFACVELESNYNKMLAHEYPGSHIYFKLQNDELAYSYSVSPTGEDYFSDN